MQSKYPWAGLAIMSMWVAVLFTGIYGSNIHIDDGSAGIDLPLALIIVAVFALIGTIFVGVRGFRA